MGLKYYTFVADHLTDGHLEQAAEIAQLARLLHEATRPPMPPIQWKLSEDGSLLYKPCDWLSAEIVPLMVVDCYDFCDLCTLSPAACRAKEVLGGYELYIIVRRPTKYGVDWDRVVAGRYCHTIQEAKEVAAPILRRLY
jgi:hypothetical protein